MCFQRVISYLFHQKHPRWVYIIVKSGNSPAGQHIPFQLYHILKAYIICFLVFLMAIHKYMFCIWVLKFNFDNEHHVTQQIKWKSYISCHFVIDLASSWTFLTYLATILFLKLIVCPINTIAYSYFIMNDYIPNTFIPMGLTHLPQSLSYNYLDISIAHHLIKTKWVSISIIIFQHYLLNGGVSVQVRIFNLQQINKDALFHYY